MKNHIRSVRRKEKEGMVHPWAALLLVGVDNLWALTGWAAFMWVITIPLSFLTVFVPTYLIQKRWRKDSTRKALAVATFTGAVAAIPTPITGTVVGTLVLGWAGVQSLKLRIL